MKLFTSFIHSILLAIGAVDKSTQLYCPRDVRVCPDFSTVIRNPELDCEFEACPVTKPAQCCAEPEPSETECGRSGCHCCSDGAWLVGNSGPTLSPEEACGLKKLLPSESCASSDCHNGDTKQCPDGSHVERDPANKCQFKTCPSESPSCPVCKSNSWTDGCNTCICHGGKPACSKRMCPSSMLLPEPKCHE